MSKKKRPPFWKALWISGIFALISIALTLYSVYNLNTFLANSRTTTGKVTGFVQQRKVFRPIVKFETEAGEIIKFTATVGASDTTQFKTGSPVKVLYHPHAPQSAIINDFYQIWQPSLMILIFGISPLLLILLLRFILVPKKSKTPDA
jgi:hypothetical protein